MFGMAWFSSFREEDLNMKVYDEGRPIPSDGKSSHGRPLAKQAKKKKVKF